MPIGCNLLLDLETHLLHTILNTKNLKFKYLIDDIVIDLILSWNFVNMYGIRRKFNPTIDLLKFVSNKKIYNNVIMLRVALRIT